MCVPPLLCFRLLPDGFSSESRWCWWPSRWALDQPYFLASIHHIYTRKNTEVTVGVCHLSIPCLHLIRPSNNFFASSFLLCHNFCHFPTPFSPPFILPESSLYLAIDFWGFVTSFCFPSLNSSELLAPSIQTCPHLPLCSFIFRIALSENVAPLYRPRCQVSG